MCQFRWEGLRWERDRCFPDLSLPRVQARRAHRAASRGLGGGPHVNGPGRCAHASPGGSLRPGGGEGREGRFLGTGIERRSAPCLRLQGMWWHSWDSKPNLYCFISCSLFSSVLLSKEELSGNLSLKVTNTSPVNQLLGKKNGFSELPSVFLLIKCMQA